MTALEKYSWQGKIVAVQPRIKLLRSFDQRRFEKKRSRMSRLLNGIRRGQFSLFGWLEREGLGRIKFCKDAYRGPSTLRQCSRVSSSRPASSGFAFTISVIPSAVSGPSVYLCTSSRG